MCGWSVGIVLSAPICINVKGLVMIRICQCRVAEAGSVGKVKGRAGSTHSWLPHDMVSGSGYLRSGKPTHTSQGATLTSSTGDIP